MRSRNPHLPFVCLLAAGWALLTPTVALGGTDPMTTKEFLAELPAGRSYGGPPQNLPYVIVEASSTETRASFQFLADTLGPVAMACGVYRIDVSTPDAQGCRTVVVDVLELHRPWPRRSSPRPRASAAAAKAWENVAALTLFHAPVPGDTAEWVVMSSCARHGSLPSDAPRLNGGEMRSNEADVELACRPSAPSP